MQPERRPRDAAPTPFSLLVKPASADCNLRCTYCFYLEKSALYPNASRHRMTHDVLEAMIGSYMRTSQPTYSIGWQGGEPTLMGVDFFRDVVALEKEHGKRGAVVANGLQTNATLIDDEFAGFLAEYNFLVGVSIDGPESTHDTYRCNSAGTGSHAAAMRGVDALKRNKVEYNALILVSAANVEHPQLVYEYLLDLGIFYHQYIPCVEFDDQGNPLPYAITGEQWGRFLKGVFDAWKKRDTHRVSIRDFDAIVGHMVTGRYSMCVQSGMCTGYFVVEHNGDVYPCDFFVEPSKRLGSVLTDGWQTMQQSKKYRAFGRQKSAWNEACYRCPYVRYCSGDCLKQRFYGGADPERLSWLCPGWKSFYAHALPELERLAIEVINERSGSPAGAGRRDRIHRPRVGWNDPCYCGSEKKYRLCHGKFRSRAG